MTQPASPSRDQLDAALTEARQRLGHRRDLTGIDVGYAWCGALPTARVALRLHVARKIPRAELSADDLFPAEIGGVPVDVIEGSYAPTETAPTASSDGVARMPYLMGGISCGRVSGMAGTMGMLVRDKRSGRIGLVSNWHVLAGPEASAKDPILHPAQPDGGTWHGNEVASLERWMLDEDGDAALALLSPGAPWLPVQSGSFAELHGARLPELGERLTKSGRTTGVTHARVDGVGYYRIPYEIADGRREPREVYGFKLVPEVPGNPDDLEIFAPGDSGAVWMDEANSLAVGLHVAGETLSQSADAHAVACMAQTVMTRLDVEPARMRHLVDAGRGRRGVAAGLEPRRQPSRSTPEALPCEAPITLSGLSGDLVEGADTPLPILWPRSFDRPDSLRDLRREVTRPAAAPLADPRDGRLACLWTDATPLDVITDRGEECTAPPGSPDHADPAPVSPVLRQSRTDAPPAAVPASDSPGSDEGRIPAIATLDQAARMHEIWGQVQDAIVIHLGRADALVDLRIAAPVARLPGADRMLAAALTSSPAFADIRRALGGVIRAEDLHAPQTCHDLCLRLCDLRRAE